MKFREILLGLVVLALLGGGVWWARGRGRAGKPAAGPAALPPVHMNVNGAPAPDVTLADGSVGLGDVRVVLSVAPRPILAFAKNRFRVRVESGGAALPFDAGRISFEMTMPMGDHRYSLVPAADGWQEAEVVLPLCESGNRRWFATVDGAVAGRPLSARFQLDLAPPEAAPPS